MARTTRVTPRTPRYISSFTIERIAAEVRETGHHVGSGYEIDIERLANELGCEVRFVQFTPPTVSARVRRQDSGPLPFLIEVNASEPKSRRRFSIAHELAHVVLHDDGAEFDFTEYRKSLSDYEDQTDLYKEVQANMLAAALLMPQELVTEYWRSRPDIDDLARRFGVSRDSAYWRVNNLRLLQDG